MHKKNTNNYALLNIYRWFINLDYSIIGKTTKSDIGDVLLAMSTSGAYFVNNADPTQFIITRDDSNLIYLTQTSAEEEYNDYLSDPGCFRDTTGDFKKEGDQDNTCSYSINTAKAEILNQKHNWFVNQVDETCNSNYCDPLEEEDYQRKWRALGPTLKKKAEEAKKKAEESKNDRNKKLKEEICKTTQKK